MLRNSRIRLYLRGLTAALIAIAAIAWPGHSATVTVDPGGGGNFTDLDAAVLDVLNWGSDPDDDVIELTDGPHFVNTNNNDIPDLTAQGSLTLRPAAGANPVVVVGSTVINAFRLFGGGDLIVHDIAFVGEAGIGNDNNATRFLLVRPANDGSATVENCIFTANDGSNGARTDWSNTPFTVGAFKSPLAATTSAGRVDFTVRNCAFAGGASGHDGPINFTGPHQNGSTVLVENVLSARFNPVGMQIRHSDGQVSAVYRDCAIIEPTLEVFKWIGSAPVGPSIALENCILQSANAGEMIVRFSLPIPGGSFVVSDCTFVAVDEGSARHIGFFDVDGGSPDTVSITGSIFVNAEEIVSAFPEPGDPGPDPPFGSFTFSNNAAISPGVRGPQSSQINDAILNDFGGAGPLSVDPFFTADSLQDIAGDIDGVWGWDSTTNTLFDVFSPAYCGQGFGGTDLAGGAEVPQGLCTVPSSSNENWELY